LSLHICYHCGVKLEVCPRCYSEDSKQPSCAHCAASGFLCAQHGTDWMGSVWCPPEHECLIDEWIKTNLNRGGRGEGLDAVDMPYHGEDELSYIAFICDFNSARPVFTDMDLNKAAWFLRCRNVAIEAGARVPNVLRGGPLPGAQEEPEQAPLAVSASVTARSSPSPSAPAVKRRWWQR